MVSEGDGDGPSSSVLAVKLPPQVSRPFIPEVGCLDENTFIRIRTGLVNVTLGGTHREEQ